MCKIIFNFISFTVMEKENIANGEAHQDSNMPIVVVIPGLTSDSDSVVSFLSSSCNWNKLY